MQICIFREKGRQVGVGRIRHVPHLHRDLLQPSNGTAGEEVARGLLNSMWNVAMPDMGSILSRCEVGIPTPFGALASND